MIRAWKIVAVSLVLAACSAGPKYRRPAVPTPPAFKELSGNEFWQTAQPGDTELRGTWWELFGDPQLNNLEEMVAVSNQNVKGAEARFRQARALLAANRADYFPTLSAQPSLTTSYQSRNLGSHRLGPVGAFTTHNLPLGVSWEPDLWGRVRLSVENAAANAQASAADLESMKLSMQGDLAADYFEARGLDMQMQLLRDTIAGYEKALQLTINRFNGGVASKADVYQAQTQLDSTRAQLTDLAASRAALEHAIAVLTGRPPADYTLPTGSIGGLPPPIPTGVPAQLLQRRPDIAAAERLVAAANAQIGLARVAFYPAVALSVTGGLESTSWGNWLSWPSRFWSVGPNLAETIFDFGRRRAQNQQAEANYDATVAAYRQTVLSAFQEVEDNLAALRVLAQEAVEQDNAVKAAENSLRLELDRYKAGTVSYLDVITTQAIALANERTAVTIFERRMTSTVQLIRALGGGWRAP